MSYGQRNTIEIKCLTGMKIFPGLGIVNIPLVSNPLEQDLSLSGSRINTKSSSSNHKKYYNIFCVAKPPLGLFPKKGNARQKHSRWSASIRRVSDGDYGHNLRLWLATYWGVPVKRRNTLCSKPLHFAHFDNSQ